MKCRKLFVAVVCLLCILGHRSSLAATPLPSRSGQALTSLTDGRILVTGGLVDGQATNIAQLISANGSVQTLDSGLLAARAGHTATALPDGTVLIFGGIDGTGHYVRSMEIFNVQSLQSTQWAGMPLVPRTAHTATLLTDGRVVIIGGTGEGGTFPDDIQFWNFATGEIKSVDIAPLLPRQGHTASLLADGQILIAGGMDAQGKVVKQSELFHPDTTAFRSLQGTVTADEGQTAVLASFPQDGASTYPITDFLKLRFSALIDSRTLSATTVALTTIDGTSVPTSVNSGERGRLGFVIPVSTLIPGTDYLLTLKGIQDVEGNSVDFTVIHFHTDGDSDDGANDGWIPDTAALAGNWNSQTTSSKWQNLPPLNAARGVTALSGQVLGLSGKPLAHVTLKIENSHAESDDTGRFLIQGISPGHKVLVIDGSTANKKKAEYGFYESSTDIVAGTTTHLNYIIWMTKLDTAHAVRIPSPTTAEDTVISSQLIPGLALHLPAGTTIVGRDGKPISQLTITPIPLDKPPFPLPTGLKVPLYFTIQPGGSEIRIKSAGAKSTGAQLYYPNSYNEPPGTPYNFWNYDPVSKGWYVYGSGAVSASRTNIIPNAGVYVYELTGAMVGGAGPKPPIGNVPGAPGAGDPVDLGSGQFSYTKTDLALPDTIPINLTRTYIANDHLQRPFGIGTTDNYDMFIVGDTYPYTYQELILPNGTPIRFNRTSTGTGYADAVYLSASTSGQWYGATISWSGCCYIVYGGSWVLRTRDGTTYAFPDGYGQNSQIGQAVLGIRDRNGNQISLARGASGILNQISSPNGRTITLSYDAQSRITQAVDSSGRTVTYTYDSGGHLYTVTDVNGGVTTFTYNSNDLMTTITDPRNILFLTNQYDSFGRVIQQTQADGSNYFFQWNPSSNASQLWTTSGGAVNRYTAGQSEGYTGLISQVNVTDPRGYVRQVTMDNLGRTVTDTKALGETEQQTTTTQYYSDNLIQSMTDQLGRTTAFDYDALGNTKTLTELSGTSNAVTYSAVYDQTYSNLLTFTDPLNHTSTLTYETHGNLIQTQDPLGHGVTVSNDSSGRPISVTDALGNAFTLSYSGADLGAVTDPIGNQTLLFTDTVGRPITVTDPLGNITQYQYDNFNHVTTETNAQGQQAVFTYDPNGNLLTVSDFLSHVTQFTYDNMDRAIYRKDPLNRISTLSYDFGGNPVTAVDRKNQTTTLTFDGIGRATGVGFGTVVNGSTTTYQSTVALKYDGGNRLTSMVDSAYGTITRGYDGLNRLLSETTPQGSMGYTYDTASRRSTATPSNAAAITYGYDNANRITSVTQGSSQVGFGYDNDNRRATLNLPNGITVGYGYDQDSRLQTLSYANSTGPLGNLSYVYDAAGRKTAVNGTFAKTNLPSPLTSATYDTANELTAWNGSSITYDANGSTLTDVNGRQYTWDARNHLTSITGGASGSFAYDPWGRRVTATAGGQTTAYLYDGANKVSETTATGTATLLPGGIDEYFQRTDSSGVTVPLADDLGSTLAMASSSGSLLTQYTYDPYGSTTISGSASGNTSEYTGRESDATGLYYYRARYYSPNTGRFLSEDPAGFRGGINKYAYAFGSPTNLIDPSGNNAFAPALSGFGDAAEFGELIGAAQFIPGLNAVVDTALTAAAAGAIVYAGYEILSAANTASPDPGRKPEGNCCFAAGTPVHTDHGEVAVEKVGVGDKVLSRNRSTGKLEYQKVIALTHPHLDGLVELHVAGEHDALRPSLDHPFWVKRISSSHADWLLAAKIHRGDLLQTTEGGWKKVLSTKTSSGQQIVYNFTVDQNHDYFVGQTGFLVHNEDNCECGPVDDLAQYEQYWDDLTGRAPEQSGPYNILNRYDQSGNLVGATTYDALGNRAFQYEFPNNARHGPGYHSYDNSGKNMGCGKGPRSGHISF